MEGLNNKISLGYTTGSVRSFSKILEVKDRLFTYLHDWKAQRQSSPKPRSFVNKTSTSSNFLRFLNKKFMYAGLIVVLVALFIVGVNRIINFSSKSKTSDEIKVQGAKASKAINKEFSFPLRDDEGEEVSKIKYQIENAELRDEIIVKGQKAVAVEGRTFLIITLKVTNEHNQPIEINTKDYIRLSINGNKDEWLAPDIHNDPVEVQAISTKYTRVGFPINDDDKDLTLRVGEIGGDKEEIKVSF
jgi:hypothetical protein